LVAELYRFSRAALEQHLLHLLRQLVPRRLDIEAVMARERLNELEVMRIAPIPTAHRAASQRQMRMPHDALPVEGLVDAEAFAGGTGANRVIEGKHLRFERRHAVAANRASVTIGKYELFPLRIIEEADDRRAAGNAQRRFERFRETLRAIGLYA